MSNALRRLPFAAKVHAFQTEIGCKQHLVTRWDMQNCAVVTDADNYLPRLPLLSAAKLSNKLAFWHRHAREQVTRHRKGWKT
jgi:hypothetical protein